MCSALHGAANITIFLSAIPDAWSCWMASKNCKFHSVVGNIQGTQDRTGGQSFQIATTGSSTEQAISVPMTCLHIQFSKLFISIHSMIALLPRKIISNKTLMYCYELHQSGRWGLVWTHSCSQFYVFNWFKKNSNPTQITSILGFQSR